jgi:hypothetical protein
MIILNSHVDIEQQIREKFLAENNGRAIFAVLKNGSGFESF